MLRKSLLVAVLAAMVIFIGCSDKDNDDTPINNAPFTFFKVGNEWVYGIYNNGEINDTTKLKIVEEIKNISTIIHYKVIFDDKYDENKFAYWFDSPNTQIYLTPFNFYNPDSVFNRLAYDFEQYCYVGFKKRYNATDNIEVIKEILSISDTVVVPAGIFYNCIKIKTTPLFGIFDNYSWYHKNYGIIMMEEGEVTYKLHKHNLGFH
jgi:hypothetical protein